MLEKIHAPCRWLLNLASQLWCMFASSVSLLIHLFVCLCGCFLFILFVLVHGMVVSINSTSTWATFNAMGTAP